MNEIHMFVGALFGMAVGAGLVGIAEALIIKFWKRKP